VALDVALLPTPESVEAHERSAQFTPAAIRQAVLDRADRNVVETSMETAMQLCGVSHGQRAFRGKYSYPETLRAHRRYKAQRRRINSTLNVGRSPSEAEWPEQAQANSRSFEAAEDDFKWSKPVDKLEKMGNQRCSASFS